MIDWIQELLEQITLFTVWSSNNDYDEVILLYHCHNQQQADFDTSRVR